MQKQTKILATISTNRCEVEFLQKLYDAGMNAVRINTAHSDIPSAKLIIDNVRKVSDKIAILFDTKGPEIRTSASGENVEVKTGDIIKIKGNPTGVSNSETIYVSYSNICEDVNTGDFLLIDDGEIEFQIIDKIDNYLLCRANNPGTVKPRKGVNIPNAEIKLPSLTGKDLVFIDYAIEEKIDFIAHSFVRNAQDVLDIKSILKAKKSNIKIIAKIENRQGIDNIDEILDQTYGIMVARGDLGIEVPAEKIPPVQRYLIDKCVASKKPVIIATQMLHTMIEHPRPTRAEVSDVASAIYQRADAIMLSGETATGLYPLESVNIMTKIANEVERHLGWNSNLKLTRVHSPICASLTRAAADTLETLPVKAVILDTMSGRTGRYISAYRINVPIYAMCYDSNIMRQLALSYGVTSYFVEQRDSRENFLSNSVSILLKNQKIEEDDLVLVIGGSFGANYGASFIEISTAKALIINN